MHLLLVTKYFPPSNTVASQRLYSFAKYLPEFDIKVTVLTPKRNGDTTFDITNTPIIHTHEDRQPLNRFTKNSKLKTIFKYTGIRAIRHYCTSKFYHKGFVKRNKLLNIDAIMTSYGPEDALRLGYRLSKFLNVPLIIDYRDLWLDNPFSDWTLSDKMIIYYLEKKIIKSSRMITCVSKTLSDSIYRRYKAKAHVIYNGYFNHIEENNTNGYRPHETIKLCYCGSLYGGIRPIEKIFDLLLLEKRFCLDIAVFDPLDIELINNLSIKYGVEKRVRCYENLSYKASIALQQNSHILVYLNKTDGSAKGVLSGKIFEYMAANKPIIGIGHPEDEAAQLIRNYNLGIYISNPLTAPLNLDALCSKSKDISFFTRKNQAKKLATLLKEQFSG